MRILLSFFLLGISMILSAQDMGIGQWRTYASFNKPKSVAQNNTHIFACSANGLMMIEKEEPHSTELISKVNGLNDAGFNFIKYSPENEMLLIVYNNSNIDILMNDNTIINFPDIKNTTSITGDKTINSIYFNEKFAYLSCGFGVVKMDLEALETRESAILNISFNSVAALGNQGFASFDEGIYPFDLNTPNLANTTDWELANGKNGLPESFQGGPMILFNNKIYSVINNDSLYTYDGNLWEPAFHIPFYSIKTVSHDGKHLLLNMVDTSGKNHDLVRLDDQLNATHFSGREYSDCIARLNQAIEDQNGNFWIVDDWKGLRRLKPESGNCRLFTPNSPYSGNVFRITATENSVWVAPGKVNISWRYQWNRDGIFRYFNDKWFVFREYNPTSMTNILDFLSIKEHPESGHIYAASYGDGLVVYNKNKFTQYKEGYFEPAIGDTANYKISDLTFDEDNNLWVINHTAEHPLVKIDPDWNFTRYKLGNFNRLTEIVIDRNGYKWMTNYHDEAGITVFDENEGMPRVRHISSNNSVLPVNGVVSLAIDQDGEIWAGTNQGIVIFQCSSQIFEDGCQGTRKIVNVGGYNGYLLETENITAIAVDGANRKWVGTENGLFLLSPDGEEDIFYFTIANSPLLSNVILDVAVHPTTGEVFIGTEKGLVSYRAEATEGKGFFSEEAYAFPNPVKPDYEGPIAIKGLARDADIKITDISGTLIYEGEAFGGQAVWNGRDYNGRKAASGVYLVFAVNSSGEEALVTKLVIVN